MRRLYGFLLVLLVLFLAACSQDLIDDGSINLSPLTINWFEKTGGEIPGEVFEANGISFGVNGNPRTYVFSGFYAFNNGRIPTTRTSRYYVPTPQGSPASWTTIAPLPDLFPSDGSETGLTHAGVARYNNKIYLAGGFLGDYGHSSFRVTKEVFTYDINSNTWSTTLIPDLPEPRAGGGLAQVQNPNTGVFELHFFSGLSGFGGSTDIDEPDHWYLPLNSSGGPAASQWVARASVPFPRNHFGVAVGGPGTSIYIIAGQVGYVETSSTGERNGVQSDVRRYNVATNSWTKVASTPIVLGHIGSSVISTGTKFYVFGGSGDLKKDLNTIYVYNTANNTWTKDSNLLKPRSAGVAGLGNASTTGDFVFTTGRYDNNCSPGQVSICDETFQGTIP